MEFDQYLSIEKNKADTIYCGPLFSLQTFDILSYLTKFGLIKTFDTLQKIQISK
jgi:hypothetical protein